MIRVTPSAFSNHGAQSKTKRHFAQAPYSSEMTDRFLNLRNQTNHVLAQN